jgi:hypothetical protein
MTVLVGALCIVLGLIGLVLLTGPVGIAPTALVAAAAVAVHLAARGDHR